MSSLQDPFQVIDGVNDTTGIKIKWRVTDEAKQFILNKPFDYLILDSAVDDGSRLDDLDFLVDAKNKIKSIIINTDKIDWNIINQLDELQVVKIGGWFDCRGLDFRKLTNLVYLETDWNKGYEDTLCDLKALRGLKVNGCKVPDLTSFGKMPNLEYFSLVYSRTPKSLDGVEQFKKLTTLILEANSNIENIGALSLCKRLQYLWLVNCKRMNKGEDIANIDKLSHLILVGQMNTLNWLQMCKNLMSMRLDCKAEDGTLDFLYDMPKLKYISYNNKKNYSVKIKDIQTHLAAKGHDQEEVWNTHGLGFPNSDEFLS